MKLSIIIPCYNESKNIPLLYKRIVETSINKKCEVILVDNGSTDDSSTILRNIQGKDSTIRIVTVEKNQGYGHGILSGLRAATGEILSWTHADLQTDIFDMIKGFEFFEISDDPNNLFVKGRRYGRPIADTLFTIGMSIFETILMKRYMVDINAQPTMFHRTFYEKLTDAPNDFSLDLYVYYQAKFSNLEIRRFDVLFGERAHGVSNWNINWQAKLNFIKRTLTYSVKLKKSLGQK